MKRLQQFGFSLIEMMVAIAISIVLLFGVVSAFQNFSSFNTWIFHFSSLQQQSSQEVLQMEKAFNKASQFLSVPETSVWFKSFLSRENDSLKFHYASAIPLDSLGSLSLTSDEARLAIHNSVLYSGMIQVGTDIFIVDTGNNVVRRLDASVSPIQSEIYAGKMLEAGIDNAVNSLDATFRNPTGITYYNGKLYVVDTGNHVVRSIQIAALAANRNVETVFGREGVAGNGSGILSETFFNTPTAITVNENTGDFYVSDTGNHVIKKLNSVFSQIILGTGVAEKTDDTVSADQFLNFSLDTPIHLDFSESLHSLFINDFANNRILRLREGLNVATISQKKVAFGGLKLFTSTANAKEYLEYQNLNTGNIYSMDISNGELEENIYPNLLNGFDGNVYLNQNFLRNTNDENTVFVFAFQKSDSNPIMFQLDTNTLNLGILFGAGGYLGNLKTWNVQDFVFNEYKDFIGKKKLIQLLKRENISGKYLQEALLRFSENIGKDQTIEMSYSVILGKYYAE